MSVKTIAALTVLSFVALGCGQPSPTAPSTAARPTAFVIAAGRGIDRNQNGWICVRTVDGGILAPAGDDTGGTCPSGTTFWTYIE